MPILASRPMPSREAETPTSLVVTFPADQPLALDSGGAIAPLTVAYQTYGRLECRQVQRRPRVPRADGRPARRQHPPRHRQAGLVGRHGGAGPADRHRPVLRHLFQRRRRLPRHHGPGLARPRDGPRLRARPAGRHHPRHGAGAGHAGRPSRHRHAVLRDRRLDGRHAGAAMGGLLSGARLRRHADRHGGAPFLAEHRLPRGRAPGRHGRPGLARRPLHRRRHAAREGARRRPHGGPRHLSQRPGAPRQVRPQAAGPRRPDLHLRRRLPGRELPALPGAQLRRAVRRQFLPLHDPRHGLFRPRRRLRRAAGAAPSGAPGRGSAWPRSRRDWLFPTSESRAVVHALNAGGASVSFVEIETDKGHDAFLLDVPDLITTSRGFIAAAARARGLPEAAGAAP